MNHLIHKQTIDLQVNSNQNAYKLQHAVSQRYWDKVVPALEAVFDKVIGTDEWVKIEQLELNLGQLTSKELLNETFIKRLTATVEKELKQLLKTPSTTISRVPIQKGYFQQWLFFLEKGYLEQQNSGAEEQRLSAVLETLSKHTWAVHQLGALFQQQPLVLERLVLQHSTSFLQKIVQIYTQHTQDKLSLLLKEIEVIRTKKIKVVGELEGLQMEKRQLEQLFWKSVVKTALVAKKPMTWQAVGQFFLKQKLPVSIFSADNVAVLKWSDTPLWNELVQIMSVNSKAKISNIESPESLKKRNASSSVETTHSTSKTSKVTDSDEILNPKNSSKEQNQTKRSPSSISDQSFSSLEENQKKKISNEENNILNKKNKNTTPIPVILPKQKDKPSTINEDDLVQAKPTSMEQETTLFTKKDHASTLDTKPKTSKTKSSSFEIRQTQSSIVFRQDTEIFIQHAGIVLLHPYWKHYFKAIGLTQNGQFINEMARQKAVVLLHYLATGETDLPEYEMVLPKLLCDMPVDMPIDRHLELSSEELEEGESMMQVVLQHWGALGAVSNASLREGFLQRDGKLIKKALSWHLQVERKTIDILLNRLPWGLGVIKLPWKKDILQVEWA